MPIFCFLRDCWSRERSKWSALLFLLKGDHPCHDHRMIQFAIGFAIRIPIHKNQVCRLSLSSLRQIMVIAMLLCITIQILGSRPRMSGFLDKGNGTWGPRIRVTNPVCQPNLFTIPRFPPTRKQYLGSKIRTVHIKPRKLFLHNIYIWIGVNCRAGPMPRIFNHLLHIRIWMFVFISHSLHTHRLLLFMRRQ